MRIQLIGPIALLCLLQAGSAIAEVILTTDKPTYVVGEIVRITAHNVGPEDEELVSFPYFVIWSEASGQCVYGCLGVPVVELFPAGETVSTDRDTGALPDAPGTYLVSVAIIDGPSTSYELTAPIPAQTASWTTLKGRYR